MKRFYVLLFGLSFFMLISSCSKTIYFTQDMRNNLNKNFISLDKIQFYNSRKIILRRNLSYADTKVARGEIKLLNGQYVEKIIIPKNTAGVVISEGGNSISVAFENGAYHFLKFVLNDENQYQISANKWSNDYGKVKYDTLVYYIEPKSSRAVLKVKKTDRYNLQKNIRRVKGKMISH